MADTATLWHATFRKEAMDMLFVLWRDLDAAGRAMLTNALISGPPDAIFDHLAPDERQSSRDRRIFDRLIVLERVGDPPLTPALIAKMAELRERYPEWIAGAGERAHFGSWMEMRWGPDTIFSVDDLTAMSDAEVIKQLRDGNDRRKGLMDSWRQLAIAQPRRAFGLLQEMGRSDNPGPPDAWEYGLWGLRDAENAGSITDRMLALLTEVPDTLFASRDVVRGAADLLEARSRDLEALDKSEAFWRLFDRALSATSDEPLHERNKEHQRIDWVHEALNHSMGRIATAWVNALFARRPRAGEGLTSDFKVRANRLMAPARETHRLARVIGASRISYLYAVDPEWAGKTLIPCFAWRDEEEAMAMWQGYAWQARIDPQLWSVLQPHFLPLFQRERLERLGNWAGNIAQTLMLIGVAFGADEFKREDVRNAIRAMPDEMRAQAAAWLALYMEANNHRDHAKDDEPIEDTPDIRWIERIWPWIRRIWPTEIEAQTASVGEQFALAAISTEKQFPEAVDAIRPYAVPARNYQVIHRLKMSSHPDEHPQAALLLIDAFITQDQLVLFEKNLTDVVNRIGDAAPALRDDNRYRKWSAFLNRRTL